MPSLALAPEAPTHILRYRHLLGGETWLDQHRVGTTIEGVVDEISDMHAGFILVAVHRLDFGAGTITDVTADALHALAARCEQERDEAPVGALPAFDRYGVPRPREWPEEEDAFRLEHLGPSDCLNSGYATGRR